MAHDDTGTHVPSSAIDYVAIEESPAFVEHKRRHRSFVFPLAIAFLLWYFLYVFLADYAHEFMSIKVIGNINIGLLLGLSQFVTTFAITTWYVSFANRKLDPAAEKFRNELEEAERA